MVVFCPNAGLLSGIVLSLVPLLLPFHWQCLLLPVLPAGEGRLELLEVWGGGGCCCCCCLIDCLRCSPGSCACAQRPSSPSLLSVRPLVAPQAPVPFVLGILYKTPEVRAKCGSLVRCVV